MLYASKIFKCACIQILLVFLFSHERKKKQKSSRQTRSLRAFCWAIPTTLSNMDFSIQVNDLANNRAVSTFWVEVRQGRLPLASEGESEYVGSVNRRGGVVQCKLVIDAYY